MIKSIKKHYQFLDTTHPPLAKAVRYIVSGGTAALVDLGLLYIFTDVFGWWYLTSAVVAFILAFFVSFFLQKFWTFKDGSKDRIHFQLIIYLTIALVNLVVNTLLMFVGVHYLGLHYMLAQFIVAGLIACSSFFLYRRFVFIAPKVISESI